VFQTAVSPSRSPRPPQKNAVSPSPRCCVPIARVPVALSPVAPPKKWCVPFAPQCAVSPIGSSRHREGAVVRASGGSGGCSLTRSREESRQGGAVSGGASRGRESAGVSAVGVWPAAFLPCRQRCFKLLCPRHPKCCVPVTACHQSGVSPSAPPKKVLCPHPVARRQGAVSPSRRRHGFRWGEPRTGVRGWGLGWGPRVGSAGGVWPAAFLPCGQRCFEVLCPRRSPPLPRCCVPVTASQPPKKSAVSPPRRLSPPRRPLPRSPKWCVPVNYGAVSPSPCHLLPPPKKKWCVPPIAHRPSPSRWLVVWPHAKPRSREGKSQGSVFS